MAIGFQGNGTNGTTLQVTVIGDGAATTVAINLKSACFAPFFTDSNSVLPLQLASTSGIAYFDIPASGTALPIGMPTVKAITFTAAISTGTVTLTFASAPPANIASKMIAIGLLYP